MAITFVNGDADAKPTPLRKEGNLDIPSNQSEVNPTPAGGLFTHPEDGIKQRRREYNREYQREYQRNL